MPVNESSLRFYLMGRCHGKVTYQKYVFFLNIGNYYPLKIIRKKNQKELLSILHRLRIKQTYIED